ncbi:hypothetical protein BP5796_04766 [Coleophoma crateriformis]|uniref:Major facilitator superfamily (MFS) profile domain-containing protein n=1 Tax=Coleophoma crateriformis TaxID=565419 RepID=A0A3D8SAC6_9HELO|nr:hypothetical protein BP5796_04766 [Coleophoma crateriformis]
MSTMLAKSVSLNGRSERQDLSSGSTHDSSDDLKGPTIMIKPEEGVVLPLGIPSTQGRFWFQRGKAIDSNAIATQPSIMGLLTLAVGLASFVLMPPSPTQTASTLRGNKGWFTAREETIIINRVIHEDQTKSGMHNRQSNTPKLLWQSLCDYDLWPLYLLRLTFQTPITTVNQYLTLNLKRFGFGTFQTNLLVIPWTVIHMFTMLGLAYLAEVWGELTFTAMVGQV